MKMLKPETIPDELLEDEIRLAQQWMRQAAKDLRESSRHTSEDGMHHLTQACHDAQSYDAALQAERARRHQAGKYKPQKSGALPEITVKPHTPRIERAPVVPRPEPSSSDDEPERPPIIVFENGFPRAWRPGDPIHRRRS